MKERVFYLKLEVLADHGCVHKLFHVSLHILFFLL